MATRPMPTDIALRLHGVREQIADAARRSGRLPDSVRLVAVSKTFPLTAIRAAADAGQIDFGENKVQEAQGKIESASTLPLRWHFLGHLQSNKARKAAALFDVIHSVDSVDLLRKLDAGAAERGRVIEVLIQVDLGNEATKFGAVPADVPAILDAASECRHARLAGLMTLPPAVANPDDARPYFAELRRLRDSYIAGGLPAGQLAELSMGMSHDFAVAIEEGATLVRVGSAIFGDRVYGGAGTG